MVLIIQLLFFTLINAQVNSTDEISNDNIPKYSKIKFTKGNHTINRPLFHFTPNYGWMNDPNGCWYDQKEKLYHLYFQYNPNDTVWGMPLYWGHAVSSNLMTWEEKDIAIRAPDWAGAYSGSMFIDDECVTSWFQGDGKCTTNEKENTQNAIAALTWNLKNWKEVQCLSYSTDKGYVFTTSSANCPAVNESDSQFRDPQVVKVDSGRYVMSIAKSHEYAVHFYINDEDDRAKFTNMIGKFQLKGFLGYQYECPNLVHLKNSEKTGTEYPTEANSYWVLFISINPGSQQGGSSTEYFFGQFDYKATDNEPYKLSFGYNTLIDSGKDFYAMQLVYNPPSTDEIAEGYETAVGITWASNWQYTALVPTDPWRSSMAIPRQIKIGHYKPSDDSLTILYIKSRPLFDYSLIYLNNDVKRSNLKSGDVIDLSNYASGALEFNFTFLTCGDAFTNHYPGVISLYFRGGSIPEEYLRFGYNVKADAFFLDRGHTNVQWVHDNPFFTDKLSMNVYGEATETKWEGLVTQTFTRNTGDDYKYDNPNNGTCTATKFAVHGFIDRNIIELFFNEDKDGFSFVTSTNTFFFTGGNFIDTIEVEYNTLNDKGFDEVNLSARQINFKVDGDEEVKEEQEEQEEQKDQDEQDEPSTT